MEFYWEVRVAWLVDLLIFHFLQYVEEWHANRSGTGDKVLRRASVTCSQLCPCQAMVKPLQFHVIARSSHSATLGEGRLLCPLLCGPAFAARLTCVSVGRNTVLSLIAPLKSGSQIKSLKPEMSAWEYRSWRARQWSGYWRGEFGIIYVEVRSSCCSPGLSLWPRRNCRYYANVLWWRDWFKCTFGLYCCRIVLKLISPLGSMARGTPLWSWASQHNRLDQSCSGCACSPICSLVGTCLPPSARGVLNDFIMVWHFVGWALAHMGVFEAFIPNTHISSVWWKCCEEQYFGEKGHSDTACNVGQRNSRTCSLNTCFCYQTHRGLCP